jgi:hypothetical protein
MKPNYFSSGWGLEIVPINTTIYVTFENLYILFLMDAIGSFIGSIF